jgi:hypothetical protein
MDMDPFATALLALLAFWFGLGALLCAAGSWGLNRVLSYHGNPSSKAISAGAGIAVFVIVVLGTIYAGLSPNAALVVLGLYALLAVYGLGIGRRG